MTDSQQDRHRFTKVANAQNEAHAQLEPFVPTSPPTVSRSRRLLANLLVAFALLAILTNRHRADARQQRQNTTTLSQAGFRERVVAAGAGVELAAVPQTKTHAFRGLQPHFDTTASRRPRSPSVDDRRQEQQSHRECCLGGQRHSGYFGARRQGPVELTAGRKPS